MEILNTTKPTTFKDPNIIRIFKSRREPIKQTTMTKTS